MEGIKTIVAILYDGPSSERTRVLRAVGRIAILIFTLWALNLFAPFGFSGFVRASDEASNLAAHMQPVQQRIDGIAAIQAQQGQQIDAQGAMLKEIRIDQLGAKLRELFRVCCSTKTDDVLAHERVLLEIDRAQREYHSLTGEPYPLPDECPRSR